MNRAFWGILLAGLLLSTAAHAETVSVAVAANFTKVAEELAPIFKAETGHDVVYSFGATGQLYTQATQGAPFGVLLSADDVRPGQAVTAKLSNGRSYTTSVWARAQSGTATLKTTLAVTANGTTSYVRLTPDASVSASGWTLLSGTATVSWAGTLSGATLYVESTSGTTPFLIDDASLQ
jgi:hypothetical protein